MTGPRNALLTAALLTASCAPCIAQDPVADFYRGRQLAILVGFSPGGTGSLYAQAMTRTMGRHIPGNPTIIVQHMPGAGGLTVVNHIANTAPRDGTAIATTSRTAPIEPLMGNAAARFDPRQLGWLGTANVEYTTCIGWHTAKVQTLKDAFEHEMIVGGTGPAASEVVFPRAANKLTGTKFKVVLGYPGSTELLLAMERGETQGFCGIGWSFVKLRKGDWLREKKINLLFQMSLEKHPELPHVPAIIDHSRTPDDRRVWEFVLAPQEMGRPFFAPPRVAPERLAALRVAFERTLKDPAFLAEAEKSGLEVQWLGGERIEKLLDRIHGTPREIIERARTLAD